MGELTRKYNLTYWPKDGSLSMFDLAKHRLFLKRVVNKDISFPNDLYVGKTIVVYSRQLKVISYADLVTKQKFGSISEEYNILFVGFESFTTFLFETNKYDAPFHFKSIKSVKASAHILRSLKVQKDNSILILCEFIGSNNIRTAMTLCEQKANGFSGMILDAQSDKHLLCEVNECAPSAILNKSGVCSSLCLIKPHSLRDTPSIIADLIKEGFAITAITTKKLTITEAKEFYEIYQGVVAEYMLMIEQLMAGSSIILQIDCGVDVDNGNDDQMINSNKTFVEFREFVGPKDPQIAKHIRPSSLRAKYGIDRVQNAIHCTDLQQDGQLENEFFFKMIC